MSLSRRHPRATAVLLLVVSITTVSAGSQADIVRATNFGSTGVSGASNNGVWLTENANWHVRGRVLTQPYKDALGATLSDDYVPTDLVVQYSTDASSCSSYAGDDLCVYDADYGDNGLNGWNSCAGSVSGSHPNQVCDWDWVRINLNYSPPPKRIMCHEIAHSVGLRHTQEQASCVKRTVDGGNSDDLSGHDITHINSRYEP